MINFELEKTIVCKNCITCQEGEMFYCKLDRPAERELFLEPCSKKEQKTCQKTYQNMSLGQIFIQRVMSRTAFKLFSPSFIIRGKDREALQSLLKASVEIWEDKYHRPMEGA